MAKPKATSKQSDPPGEDVGDEGIPLATVGDVQRELAKVYRDMRKKRLDVSQGNGLTQTLQYLAKITAEMRAENVLERLRAIEQRQAAADERQVQ